MYRNTDSLPEVCNYIGQMEYEFNAVFSYYTSQKN